MKRALVLIGALLMSGAAVGCGSDERDGLIAATLSNTKNATNKIVNIKKEIDDAVKKAEAESAAPKFEGAEREAKALKEVADEMKKLKMRADTFKKATDEERQAFPEKFQGPLNRALEESAKALKDLNETIIAVDAQFKDALKDVKKKLAEANGEFEAISRR